VKSFIPPAFSSAHGTLDRKRIAVLPFTNISPDPNDGYFADGLTEELITTLSKVHGLRVIARTSISRYKGTEKGVAQIGNELQVGSVLEGSVRKSGNKIRVTAQLIETAAQEHVWADQYDRDLSDIFLIQSEIAKHVSEQLSIILGSAEERQINKKETENVIAHVACLKGRALLHSRTERGIRDAEEQFELALKHDPNYARAYAGLADVYTLLADHRYDSVSESLEKSRSFVKKALELDPSLAEAHASYGLILTNSYLLVEAEKEFEKAIALNPSYAPAHHWHSLLLGELGRTEHAVRESFAAEELDPLSPVIGQAAFMWTLTFGTEEEIAKRVERFSAEKNNPFALNCLLNYHLFRNEYARAMDYCAKLQQLSLDFPGQSPEPYLGYIYAVTGRRTEAQEIVRKLESDAARVGSIRFFEIAIVYVGMNDLDRCFSCLEKAFESHERFFIYFRYVPFLEKVRKDQRFVELLKRTQLPPTN
jgi:TolB-like protein/Flp pilus assembly protein TadD